MLSLSRGGSDAATLREFDIDTKTFVTDGFVLPEAKGGAEWFDADTLLLSSAYGEGMATTSGYARTVRLWRRGTDVNRAPVIFETAPDNMGGVLRASTAPAPACGCGSSNGLISSITICGSATRPARDRNSICRPTSGCKPIRIGWSSNCARRGRWADRPTRRIRCSASRCRPFWRATAISQLFSSRDRGARCRAFSGVPAGWCCPFSTNCGRFSRSGRRRQMAGPAPACRDCPRSASSMSGGSTPTNPKATATCSPISRTR